MYDLTQTILKVVITMVIFVGVAWVIIISSMSTWWLWHQELDIRRFFNPTHLIQELVEEKTSRVPIRQLDAICQNGNLVARVSGWNVFEEKNIITFEEIYKAGQLTIDNECEFQKWRLQLQTAESMVELLTSQPEKGRIIKNAVFGILGVRSAI